MGQIHFPPGGLDDRKIVTFSTCLQWGEDLTVTFGDPGFFACTTPGCFVPDLPAGNFVAGSGIGPYDAVSHDATAILIFFDQATGVLYVDTVTIQKKPCPKPKAEPKSKPKSKPTKS